MMYSHNVRAWNTTCPVTIGQLKALRASGNQMVPPNRSYGDLKIGTLELELTFMY